MLFKLDENLRSDIGDPLRELGNESAPRVGNLSGVGSKCRSPRLRPGKVLTGVLSLRSESCNDWASQAPAERGSRLIGGLRESARFAPPVRLPVQILSPRFSAFNAAIAANALTSVSPLPSMVASN
jgi:hypothetical protein